jgi:hypothetical protein
MAKVDRILADVERLVATVKPQEAEERLRSLMQTMGDDELRAWDADLRVTINRFLPKRRKSLTLILDERIRPRPPMESSPEPTPAVDLIALQIQFETDLQNLSERHIYQWSTFYRDTLSQYFDSFLDAARKEDTRDQALNALRDSLSQHSEEIFDKGFRYARAKGDVLTASAPPDELGRARP